MKPLEAARRGRRARPVEHRVGAMVAAVGVVLTALVTYASWTAYNGNEDRLLAQRTREAAAVLQASLPAIQTPLAGAVELAEATDGADLDSFARVMGDVGPQGRFVSASIWRVDGSAPEPLLTIGAAPALAAQQPARIEAFLDRTRSSHGLSVLDLLDSDQPRLGYSFTSLRSPARFMAYAEAALPEHRTAVIQPDNAFNGLDYAIYLGEVEQSERLLVAGTSDLPLVGRRAAERIAFGDGTLLLVMSPTGHLAGGLLAVLPWLLLAGGLVLTAASVMLTERLLRGRDRAERLTEEIAKLYAEQRDIAHQLQRSLLPTALPPVAGAELAVRYAAGVSGMEIGGDWYDAVCLDEQHLLLVVGDVSGRGLRAGSVMASLRHAARAFASVDPNPATILDRLSNLPDPDLDGHFATIVCALVDRAARTVTLADAGHPPPLLVAPGSARFLPIDVGPPIGIRPTTPYRAVTSPLPAAGTLLLFTDGLFERRREAIDLGLERLRGAAHRASGPLDKMLDAILAELTSGEISDDVALLGFQWPQPHGTAAQDPVVELASITDAPVVR